jgi:hypothetical protein
MSSCVGFGFCVVVSFAIVGWGCVLGCLVVSGWFLGSDGLRVNYLAAWRNVWLLDFMFGLLLYLFGCLV